MASFAPWLPLIATLIAGTFALFQIKSNNITNARIEWLEDFKKILTDFLSECFILQFKVGLVRGIDETKDHKVSNEAANYLSELNKSFLDHLKSIEAKYNLIKLNLNPEENINKKLEKLLDDYINLLNELAMIKTTQDINAHMRKMDAYSDTIILLNRYIVKLEWEKTKRPYLLRKYYIKFGKGKKILSDDDGLTLLPERNVPAHS